MTRLKLTLEYDGTEFSGSQLQPGRRTVQGVLEVALAQLYGQRIRTLFAGRTDAGVHALGQVAAYDPVKPYDPATVMRALNALLPEDLRVVKVEEVAAKFHPRYWARERHYKYLIWLSRQARPLVRRYFLVVDRNLDVVAMDLAARTLVGTSDFAAFAGRGLGTAAAKVRSYSTIRTVFDCRVRRVLRADSWPVIEFIISANSYLPHMVRNLVGTLLKVGQGEMTVSDFVEVLRSKDRGLAGPTAPAHGLYLTKVVY